MPTHTTRHLPLAARRSPLAIAILAGGNSSRMGQDKSFVPFNGRPMIETVIDRLRGLGDELILIANKPNNYAYLGLPIFGDVYPDHGSLGGIFTAVHYAAAPHVLVAACDMPWLNPDLLRYMIGLRQTADAIVPRWTQFPEPLHAIYNKACLTPIEANLKARRLKIIRFYDQVRVRFIEKEEIESVGGDGRSFANINTMAELQSYKVAGQ